MAAIDDRALMAIRAEAVPVDTAAHLVQDTDLVIEGDAEAQQALRFSIFHLISTAHPTNDAVSVGARGFSGISYFLHVLDPHDALIAVLRFVLAAEAVEVVVDHGGVVTRDADRRAPAAAAAVEAAYNDDLLTMRLRTPFAVPSLTTARSASSLRRRGSRKLEKQEPERSLGMASSRLPTGVSRLRGWPSLQHSGLYAETEVQAVHEATWPIRDSFPQQVPGHDRAPGQSERGWTLV